MAKTKQKTPSAAQRREQQRQQRTNTAQKSQTQTRGQRKVQKQSNRSSWFLIGGVLVLVAIIIVAFIIISHQSSGTAVTAPTPVNSSVLKAVTNVDPNISNTIGTGNVQDPLQAIKNSPSPLTGSNGKPEFLYMGAEYCPYCAAERWAMIAALSRFGTFSNLSEITSSSTDIYPSTPTFTFYHATYTSSYIDFVSVELEGNVADSSGNYPTLQTPTSAEQNLINTYDAPPYVDSSDAGSIPFIDIGNKYVQIGLAQGYSAQDLSGLQWQDIATDLSDSSSPVAQHIIGSANYLTAALCIETQQQPASACSSDAIHNIELKIASTAFNGGGSQVAAVAGHFDVDVRRQG